MRLRLGLTLAGFMLLALSGIMVAELPASVVVIFVKHVPLSEIATAVITGLLGVLGISVHLLSSLLGRRVGGFGRLSRAARASLPPRNLELILYLIVPQHECDPLIGDLEERYRRLVKRLGKGRADIWYTKQVLTSIWPLLRANLRHMRSSAVVAVVGFVLRLFGAGTVADELKRAIAKK